MASKTELSGDEAKLSEYGFNSVKYEYKHISYDEIPEVSDANIKKVLWGK